MLPSLRSEQHTPGPWKIKSEYHEPYIIGNCELARPIYVATVESDKASNRHGYDAPKDAANANARLIAAAPEMLAMLTLLVEQEDRFSKEAGVPLVDGVSEAVEAARALLASLERSEGPRGILTPLNPERERERP